MQDQYVFTPGRLHLSKTTKRPQRAWINQPSTLQPLHHLHGVRVLAQWDYDNTFTVYFLDVQPDGRDVVSCLADGLWLSAGWPEKA